MKEIISRHKTDSEVTEITARLAQAEERLVYTRAETDGKFYYPDILNTIFPDILRIVTSLFAIEALYF